jgi:ribosomal protein S18 acetylase RimI-like enzyme
MSEPTTSLRAALDTDCSSLAALSIEVWLNSYIREGISGFFADYALSEFTADRFVRMLDDPSELLIVSQNRTGIDGYVRLRTGHDSPAGNFSDTEIATLYVQPRHQGKRIGLQLLNAALSQCQTKGWAPPWLAVNSENAGAIAFYQRNGFTTVGQTHFRIQGTGYLNDVLQFGS